MKKKKASWTGFFKYDETWRRQIPKYVYLLKLLRCIRKSKLAHFCKIDRVYSIYHWSVHEDWTHDRIHLSVPGDTQDARISHKLDESFQFKAPIISKVFICFCGSFC